MATMVLTVVGTALGGPIGAAIGATLGQVIDNQILFAPKGRQGARLSDLRVQTSRYGDGLPRLYGAMRVAGSVIWATDLIEHRQRQGGGKGQPKVTTYSYSASFAVALSSRPIKAVRRIWADGNLLRGAGRDFKTSLGAFRVHLGGEDQPVDPLIAAHKGAGATPAHRGIAYGVFEDMQLGDYGNRIPSLTFEVIADDGAVAITTIAHDLSRGVITDRAGTDQAGQDTPSVIGYAATGATMADALAPLSDALDMALVSGEQHLQLVQEFGEILIPASWMGARFNGAEERGISLSRGRVEDVPQSLTVRYYDPARDYQAGAQGAQRPGAGWQGGALDLPASLEASAARSLAEMRLRRHWAGRSIMELRCDWRALSLTPAMKVQVEGHSGLWRVEECEWEAMAVRLRLKRLSGGVPITLPASSGDGVQQNDSLHGPTSLIVADLPPAGGELATAPLVVVAAAGREQGWRMAELFIEDIATGGLTSLGASAPPAVMGQVHSLPDEGGCSALFDDKSVIEIELLHDHMELTGADDAALLAGANRALVGQEVIQFGRAIPIGSARWRLGHLLRGRRGTEWAMTEHLPGERFVMLEEQSLFPIPANMFQAGMNLSINAIGVGDTIPVQSRETIMGQAIIPLSPVHLQAIFQGEEWQLSWTRRSRNGWHWADHVDAPLGEEQERYLITLTGAGGVIRQAEVIAPEWRYDSAAMDEDRAQWAAGGITFSVQQIGTYGIGRSAVLPLVL
ncbi:MAG: hypothetical protein E2598_11850 [Sphingobium sp.]|nr:hypothetical protein [Sphingobium sp.]